MLVAVELLRREVGADRLRIVDREHAVDVREAGQVALHDVQAAFARALGVLVVGQDLDVRVLRETSLQPFTRSITDETCGPFWMTTLPLPPILSAMILAGDLARLDVVRLHRGVGPGRGDVDRDDDDARRLGALHRRRDRLRVGRVEQDQVDAGGDEVVDLGELLVQVVVGRDRRDLDVRVDLLGLVLGALDERDEERIAERADA